MKNGSYKRKDKKSTLGFVFPGFLGILAYVLIPLGDVFISSFQKTDRFVGLDNYKVVLGNEAFKLAASNTVKFELISVPLLILISLIVSIEVYSMESNLIKFAFLIPLAIPSNSLAVVLRMLFDDQGIVNNMIQNIGFGKTVSFFSGNAVFWLLVGTFLFKNIGYNMLIWLAGLASIPNDIYDAAKVDGAGRFIRVWKITLPNMKRSFFIVSMLSVVNSLKIFREQYLITGGYPDAGIYQIQHVFNNWFEKLEISKLAAGAVLTAITFFIIILLIRVLCLSEWRSMFSVRNKMSVNKRSGTK